MLRNINRREREVCLVQFIAALAGGGILSSILGFGLLLALFGLEPPAYGLLIVLFMSFFGSYIGISLARKSRRKLNVIIIGVGLLLFIPLLAGLIAFGPGFEDIDFIGAILLTAIIITLIPSAVTTIFVNRQIIFNKRIINKQR